MRGQGVVAVEEEQVLTGGAGEPGVAGGARPLARVGRVRGQVDGGDPGIAGGELVDDLAAGVRGAGVDRDQFQVERRALVTPYV